MKKVGMIGLGRFGGLLANIIKDDHDLTIHDTDPKKTSILPIVPIDKIAACDTVFICTPIHAFEDTIKQLAPIIDSNATVIDTCSVKVYPAKVMKAELPDNVGILASHPLFGPDSLHVEGPSKFLLHPLRDTYQQYEYWHGYFQSKDFEMIDLTPDEHDRYAARSQGITHLLGRTLEKMGITQTPIDTLGFERLQGIINQTCNDSEALFTDLQRYNPYTKETLKCLIDTLQTQAKTLLQA